MGEWADKCHKSINSSSSRRGRTKTAFTHVFPFQIYQLFCKVNTYVQTNRQTTARVAYCRRRRESAIINFNHIESSNRLWEGTQIMQLVQKFLVLFKDILPQLLYYCVVKKYTYIYCWSPIRFCKRYVPFFILLTHKRSHREAYQDFQLSLTSSKRASNIASRK